MELQNNPADITQTLIRKMADKDNPLVFPVI